VNFLKVGSLALSIGLVAGRARQAVVFPAALPATAVTSGKIVSETIGPPVPQHHVAGVELPRVTRMGVVGYPEEARLALISGTVVTLTCVGKDGVPFTGMVESQRFVENSRDKMGNVVPLNAAYSIVRKDGSIAPLADLFDPLAIHAMLQARFSPRKKAGVAIPSIVRIPVAFGLAQR
jgi:outer membrane biosynthesis protein TonB